MILLFSRLYTEVVKLSDVLDLKYIRRLSTFHAHQPTHVGLKDIKTRQVYGMLFWENKERMAVLWLPLVLR